MTNSTNVANNLSAALAHLLGGLAAIAGAVGGLSAVAYYVGWRDQTAYYGALGCPWFVSMLSASDFIQVSTPLLLSVCTGVLLSFERIMGGRASPKKPIFINGVATVAMCGTLLLEFNIQKYIGVTATRYIGIVSFIVLGVSVGQLVVDLIYRLAKSELKWQAQHLWILYLLVFYGLWNLPDSEGRLRADSASDPARASLARVSIPQQSANETWRIVSAADKEFLVMSISADGKERRFRIIEAKDAILIADSRPP